MMYSTVFNEYGASFRGKVKEECHESITYKDEGKLLYQEPTVEIDYTFPFCEMYVHLFDGSYNAGTTQIKAGADSRSKERGGLFDPLMDKLYADVNDRVEGSHERLKKGRNPEIMDKYPSLFVRGLSLKLTDQFYRHFSLHVPNMTKEDMPHVESMLCARYGLESRKTDVFESPTLLLKNGASVSLDGLSRVVTISMPCGFTVDAFEEMKISLIEDELVKKWEPSAESDTLKLLAGYIWSAFFQNDAYPVLIDVFKEDVGKLPVIKYK